ncbi:MAG: CSLREA domain-containing protein [Bacteroidota bacterium]
MRTLLALCGWLLVSLLPANGQKIFTVNSVLDHTDANPGDGQCLTMLESCTLRAAIEEANATGNAFAGPDEIHFSTSLTAPVVIRVGRTTNLALPEIKDRVILDGLSGPGAGIRIEVEDTNWNGFELVLGSAGSVIKGFIIGRVSTAIVIHSDANLIEQNIIGIVPAGEFLNAIGLRVLDGSGNILRNNVIADNSTQVSVSPDASNTVIQANRIGVDMDGNPITNASGIIDSGKNTIIGGPQPEQGNVIGGSVLRTLSLAGEGGIVSNNYIGTNASGAKLGTSDDLGISIYGDHYTIVDNTIGFQRTFLRISNCEGITVQRNYIGTNAAGDDLGVPLPANVNIGIEITNAEDVVVGGKAANQGNVVGNIRGNGIVLHNTALSVVQGNYIGTNRNGANLGNDGHGVLLEETVFDTTIGYSAVDTISTTQQFTNTIAFNGGSGIAIESAPGTRNTSLRGNRMYNNGAIGIDLNVDGVTMNDLDDADEGPNFNQNYPDILVAGYDETQHVLGVEYSIDASNAYVTFPLTVDMYLADDASSGEGKTYLGTHTYVVPGRSERFEVSADGLIWDVRDVLVLTATDPFGNTSEFSATSQPLGAPPSLVSNEDEGAESSELLKYGFALSPAYPNPFNPQTNFTLQVEQHQSVRVTVHDLLGRTVALIHDGPLAAQATHSFTFNAAGLASGSYLLRVAGEHFVDTRNLLLTK